MNSIQWMASNQQPVDIPLPRRVYDKMSGKELAGINQSNIKSRKEHVWRILADTGPATSAEMGALLGLTPQAANYQLRCLFKDGRIGRSWKNGAWVYAA